MKKQDDSRFIHKDDWYRKRMHLRSSYQYSLALTPLLTREEEFELATKSAQGDLEARQELVRHNLRFARTEADKFKGFLTRGSFELEDLFHEAVRGLILSANSYAPRRDVKFISYAVRGIRQSIQAFVNDKMRTSIHVPLKQRAKLLLYRDVKQELEDSSDVSVLVHEAAEKAGYDLEEAIHSEWLLNATHSNASLEEVQDPYLSAVYEENTGLSKLEAQSSSKMLSKRLGAILDETSLRLIEMHYNLADSPNRKPKTAEIAKVFGLDEKGFSKMKHVALKRLSKDCLIQEICGLREIEVKGPQPERVRRYGFSKKMYLLLENKADKAEYLVSLCCKAFPELQVTPKMLRNTARHKEQETRFARRLASFVLTQADIPIMQIASLVGMKTRLDIRHANSYVRHLLTQKHYSLRTRLKELGLHLPA
jgi:RNA polymerase sigma factor (sigma-70 family)